MLCFTIEIKFFEKKGLFMIYAVSLSKKSITANVLVLKCTSSYVKVKCLQY